MTIISFHKIIFFCLFQFGSVQTILGPVSILRPSFRFLETVYLVFLKNLLKRVSLFPADFRSRTFLVMWSIVNCTA